MREQNKLRQSKKIDVPGLVENVERKKYRKGTIQKKIGRQKYRKKKYIEGKCRKGKYRKGKCGKHDGENKMKRFM